MRTQLSALLTAGLNASADVQTETQTVVTKHGETSGNPDACYDGTKDKAQPIGMMKRHVPAIMQLDRIR